MTGHKVMDIDGHQENWEEEKKASFNTKCKDKKEFENNELCLIEDTELRANGFFLGWFKKVRKEIWACC